MQEGQTGTPVIRVLIADQITCIVEDLEKLADYGDRIDVCGIARQAAGVVAEAELRQPDVLLMREGFGGLDTASVAEQVASVSPATKLLLLSADGAAKAELNGAPATEAIPETASGAEMLDAIQRVAGVPAPPTSENGEAAAAVPEETPEEELIQDVPARRPRRPGRTRAEVMLVFSGKGGVGKSVIATNLAVALAGDTGARVAMIDLDLQYGDIGVMLRVENHLTSIDDLSQQGEQVEGEFLDEVMASGPEDIRLLLAPSSPEFADLVTTGNLRSIFREMSKAFDYIVVDMPAHLEERTLETIEMADQIILVTGFNVTSVKNAKITLRLFEAMGVERDRVVMVLNQTRPKVGFPAEEVEKILRCRMLAKFPYEPRIDDSIDTGRPIVLAEPKSDFSKQIHAVVKYLAPEESEVAREPRESRSPAQRANRRRFSLGRR
jgi:pilus assembly protein CpaE